VAHFCVKIGRAIELDGRNAVYYFKRAAAHSKLNQHQAAINDCKKAIAIDPSYSKAYERMGYAYIHPVYICLFTQFLIFNFNFSLAHASLNQHAEAVQCYQRAVELEPENESYQSNLQIAEEKLRSSGGPAAGIPSIPGIPDLGGMLNNPGWLCFTSFPSSLVLVFSFSISFFISPHTGLMSMDQQMLSNPSMQQL